MHEFSWFIEEDNKQQVGYDHNRSLVLWCTILLELEKFKRTYNDACEERKKLARNKI